MKEYPINEYFGSMQGEGNYTGTPSFFIRTQGCNVHCVWCDTKHTWNKNSDVGTIKDKTCDSSVHEYLSAEVLVHLAGSHKHIVITGGEPCLHDLTELTTSFIEIGSMVQIETSGTVPIVAHPFTWITLSPKLDNPRKLPVLEASFYKACEFKFPVIDHDCIEKIENFLREYDVGDIPIWLQPVSQSEKATAVCLDVAREKGWRVSVQVHKFIGLR